MANLPPEAAEVAQGEPQAMPAQGKGASPSEMVARVHSDIAEVSDLLQKAGQDDAAQKCGAFAAAWRDFVEQELGSAPGEKPQAAPQADMGQMPMMAGAREVKPAL